jgi:prepilin-type N-terminal cleavage/methylation domain-containing protein
MFTSKLSPSKLSKGFTLIELLVVIAIIGILSSVVLASMNSARKKSRDSRRQQDIKGYATALELSFDKYAGYPAVSTAATPVKVVTLAALVTDGFVPVLQDDPLTTQFYWYVSDSVTANAATTYCVGVKMEGTPPAPNNTCNSTLTGNIIVSGAINSAAVNDYLVGP